MTDISPPGRFQDETAKAYSAFCDYLALGPGRSLEKLAALYRERPESAPTRHLSTLGEWSSSNAWQQRIQAYEDVQQRATLARRAEERAGWADAVVTREWEAGEALWAAGEALLSDEPNARALESISRALVNASELQRRAAGLATQRSELAGPGGAALASNVVIYLPQKEGASATADQ